MRFWIGRLAAAIAVITPATSRRSKRERKSEAPKTESVQDVEVEPAGYDENATPF